MGTTQSNETLLCTEPRDNGVYYFTRFEYKPFASGTCRHAYKGTLHCNKDNIGQARYNNSSVVVKVFKGEYAKGNGA